MDTIGIVIGINTKDIIKYLKKISNTFLTLAI